MQKLGIALSAMFIGCIAASSPVSNPVYCAKIGVFDAKSNAETFSSRFTQQGYPILQWQQGKLSFVSLGPYSNKDELVNVISTLRDKKILRQNPEDGIVIDACEQ